MIPLIVIRPEPGCSASLSAARAMPGLEAHGFPLFEVVARSWEPPAPDRFDALLVGSAAALAAQKGVGDGSAAQGPRPR